MNLDPNLDMFDLNKVPLWEYGQTHGRNVPINLNTMFQITKEITDVFNELGIKYSLSHGTMLGVYRQGDAIPYDDDVDLAMFASDRPKHEAARAKLRSLGWFVVPEGNPDLPIDPKSNAPYADFVGIKLGHKVEGWIFDKIGKFYIYDIKRDGLTIPDYLFDTLSTIQWRGHTFYAPSNVDKFLTLMYGPGWRTPDQNKKYNNLRPKDFA